ncbi:MAG: HEAT repeat domain-containing protein [Acidobacteriota bacterium]|nr:HEAT repeat domain-containing protein [Acidobacteriota bacterium]
MNRWIERALNIQRGDLRRGLLLSSCLFLTISASVIGKVARDALFLGQFPAIRLPYADIASGVLVGFLVVLYLRLGRNVSLSSLLVASPMFFGLVSLSFWFLAHHYRPTWLSPVFYIWVGIFGVLAPTQVWTLANYLLTTREAKRIFGMVGGAGICGWIFAGYVSKIVTRSFGTESLLLCMTVLPFICAALVAIASRGGALMREPSKDPVEGIAGTGQRELRDSVRAILSSPYLRAITVVICISSFATTLTGWQFKALAKLASADRDSLAIFFGNFYFYAGLLALLFQLLLTTRLLRRFGIGPMLFALPIVVLAGSAGLALLGTVGAALFLKGGDQVLRYSIDRSTIELLYLPLPQGVKLQAKWFIDTVVWRMGDGLAGIVVLIFAAQLHWTPRQLSWIAMGLTLGWLAAVHVAGKQYVAVLKDSISRHRLDAEQATTLALDRNTADLLAGNLLTSDPKEILYALSLFEVERKRAAHPVVRGLLSHPEAEVRRKAISLLSSVGDKSVLPSIEQLLKDSDYGVRSEALLYLVYHTHVDPLTLLEKPGEIADFSVRSAVAAYLARPGVAQSIEAARAILEEMCREQGESGERTRLEVARLLSEIPDSFDPLLATLLIDTSHLVAREAMRSAGALRKFSVVPILLEHLSKEGLCGAAAEALTRFGDEIAALLGEHLSDGSSPIASRRAIPAILAGLGTATGAQALLDNLMETDTAIRFQVISALNKIQQAHPEIKLDSQLLETVLAAEIMGHYRSYQILESLRIPGNADEPIARALRESIQQELERIFRLLGLLYPRMDLHSAYFGLQSSDVTIHDNALEFLENVLKSQLRGMLVPLLDGKVSAEDRAGIAKRFVRAPVVSREQAVAELIASDDPWLKSCGAYAIGTLGMESLKHELERCLAHPDPLLRETARTAKMRLKELAAKSRSSATV